MTERHTFTLDAKEIEAVESLKDLQSDLDEIKELHSKAVEKVEGIFASHAHSALKDEGYEHGSRTAFISDEDGKALSCRVGFEVKRTVSWDTEALEDVIRYNPQTAHALINVKLNVAERSYNKLVEEAAGSPEGSDAAELLERVQKARTTKLSSPKFKIIKD
ncbi:MAG: hypothetical protein JKY94_01160 [Rhodobacteraceae bacterium]|nr:hypothetical protein [Paracoccaceae bacterium]